ncbi:MAG: FHA domain-containing serine/threonine-protein kinase [Thermomicrobiales bacterium]
MAERFTLEIVQGPDQGKRIPLSEASTTIGRHADATITLGDEQASRRHARIDLLDDILWIRDLGSANGTFVNGTQLRQPFALSPGDTILIGNTTLRLLATEERAPRLVPPPAPLPPEQMLDAATRLAHSSGTAPTRPHRPGAMQAVAPGMTLNDRYELGEQIGQGGFARVYVAIDLLLKRQIAIKVLNSDLAESEGQSFLDRFAQEAQSIASLDHPNILGIHDFGEALGTVFLVMPYVEGGTLIQLLRSRGKLDPAEAGTYLRQAAAALDYAHRRNLVHRDVKPQNMLLRSDDGRLLLSDFGIAKVVSSASAQSSTGVMGTIAYMAPEQLQGRVTPATDIYALGCVLFQMLTGQLPFTGPTEQVMFGHLTAPIPTLLERGGGHVPPGVQGVLERALAKRPEARFRTAGELAAAYDAVISGKPLVAAEPGKTQLGITELQTPPLTPGATEIVAAGQAPPPPPLADPHRTAPLGPAPGGYYSPPAAPPPVVPPPPYPSSPPQPERTGRRAFLIGGAITGLALLGGAGAVILSQQGNSPATPTAAPVGQTGSTAPAASTVPGASSGPGASSAPPTPTFTPGTDPAAQAQAATATALAIQQQSATATALAGANSAQIATATAQAKAQAATATAQAAQAQAATATAAAAQAATATAQAQNAPALAATATAQARAAQTATASAQAAQKLKDAENVVKGYYDAINRRDFDTAWSLATSKVVGTDFNSWKKGYDNTVSVALTVDSSAPDGSNTRVNVHLTSQEKDGTTKRFAGYYTVGLDNTTLKMIAASIQVA